jgi:hypothetical protein
MFKSLSKALRSRKLITPRRPHNRPDEPYLDQRMRWP